MVEAELKMEVSEDMRAFNIIDKNIVWILLEVTQLF
jgi:hypothetical protein